MALVIVIAASVPTPSHAFSEGQLQQLLWTFENVIPRRWILTRSVSEEVQPRKTGIFNRKPKKDIVGVLLTRDKKAVFRDGTEGVWGLKIDKGRLAFSLEVPGDDEDDPHVLVYEATMLPGRFQPNAFSLEDCKVLQYKGDHEDGWKRSEVGSFALKTTIMPVIIDKSMTAFQ